MLDVAMISELMVSRNSDEATDSTDTADEVDTGNVLLPIPVLRYDELDSYTDSVTTYSLEIRAVLTN